MVYGLGSKLLFEKRLEAKHFLRLVAKHFS
jgi:hypothetical protein